jgi:enamine deaminase RidA (YjgF/YER057c/UK114 family)
MSDVEKRLNALGLVIPELKPPGGSYTPYRIVKSGGGRSMVYTAGSVPFLNGEYAFVGKLGEDFERPEGQAAAQSCILNMLCHLKNACPGKNLDRVTAIVKLGVFVNCTPDFVDQPLVGNGGSDLLIDVFGAEVGPHARSAVGVASLPRGVAVEIDGVFEIDHE